MTLTDSDWAALAFVIFIGILIYVKVPKLAAKALDDRSQRIEKELDDARALREEAQALLAQYQRRQAEAEREAQDIVEQAEREAKALAEQTKQALEEQIERRTKLAEDKIAQAETQAVQDVRNAAINVAVQATRTVIESNLTDDKDTALIDQAVASVKQNLH